MPVHHMPRGSRLTWASPSGPRPVTLLDTVDMTRVRVALQAPRGTAIAVTVRADQLSRS